MNIIRNIKIEGADARPLLLDMYHVQDGIRKPVVIFAHGLKGFKDWGAWDLMGKTFARAGVVFIKFNFSHNGTTIDDPLNFGDLEAFGNNNFSREQIDLGKVIDWVANGNIGIPLNELVRREVHLIGHSRGGGAVLLKAWKDARVRKLATWASVAAFGRFFREDLMEAWEKAGVHYLRNGRTGQDMPLYWQIYADYYARKAELDVAKAVADLTQPLLVVHGDKDTVVPFSAAEELAAAQAEHVLRPIEGGDHTFGAKHPWESDSLPPCLEEAVKATLAFFKY